MIERYVMTLAVGARGEDPQRTKGERGSRRRSTRAPQHVWIDRDGGGRECRWCRTRDGEEWHGRALGCGNAHAKNIATKKARKNEEARAVDAARASVTGTGEESR